MNIDFNQFEGRTDGRREFEGRAFSRDGRGHGRDFGHGERGGHGAPRGFRPEMDEPRPMPWDFEDFGGGHGAPGDFEGFGGGLRCMPRGFGPGGPGGHGGMGHGGHGMPGRPGFPPRRPNPEFLKRRVEEGDLMELIDMAGRMAQRQPRGGAARGQALILSILAGREALSQRELQQMLGIQPGSLSELLSKLEAKGFLTREKAEDRRGNLLRITDAGRAAIPQAEDAPEDDPFAPLTADEQDSLARLLRRLLTAWVEDVDVPAPRGPRPHADRPVEV